MPLGTQQIDKCHVPTARKINSEFIYYQYLVPNGTKINLCGYYVFLDFKIFNSFQKTFEPLPLRISVPSFSYQQKAELFRCSFGFGIEIR